MTKIGGFIFHYLICFRSSLLAKSSVNEFAADIILPLLIGDEHDSQNPRSAMENDSRPNNCKPFMGIFYPSRQFANFRQLLLKLIKSTLLHVRNLYGNLNFRSHTMAQGSTIEWTEATWNPVTGCTKVSAGCKHCYAERMSKRLKAMGVWQYRNGFELTLQPDSLELPLRWRKPRRIFVNSMSDLFHMDVPLDFIKRVFQVMKNSPQHTFQILTKRPEVAAAHANVLEWSNNIWMGTSAENVLVMHRIESLRKIPAAIRFLSLEPLLGPLPKLNLKGIHWVIVGGESGPGARAMEQKWVEQIKDHCLSASVPFFFKQWGGVNKKRSGRLLNGRTWDEMPSGTTGKASPNVRFACAK